MIRGYALIRGNTKIRGYTMMRGNTLVIENTQIRGNTIIRRKTQIRGNTINIGNNMIIRSTSFAGFEALNLINLL